MLTQFGREGLHARRPVPLRHRQELRRRHQRRLHARRGPAPRRHRRQDPAGPGGRAEDGVTQQELVDRISPRPARTAPRSSPARRRPRSCRATSSRASPSSRPSCTIFGGRRPAGRRLRDLQHLLDPRRPAHARAGPPPGRRRPPRADPGSVLVEAVMVGLIGALLGLGFGILLASGVTSAFASAGTELPDQRARPAVPGTVMVALVVGVVRHAGRRARCRPSGPPASPPLAALRDVAFDRPAPPRPGSSSAARPWRSARSTSPPAGAAAATPRTSRPPGSAPCS